MDEIDHVRGRKTVAIGKMDDIWIDLYAYDDTGCDQLLVITGRGLLQGHLAAAPAGRGPLLGALPGHS